MKKFCVKIGQVQTTPSFYQVKIIIV